ncbi:uncharacterized protein LOC119077316 isoform X2 [Bradysia coprophila]|uniref:uncharacterized protein LOC119077316 isoform X2 n=1 Tax=Bradysia coprophila TaxID=38358 RepID=UPI00187DA558|nr:uncharacterized protein LOC119077316 isoform X2 [Bradysia coprophila]
MCAISYAIHTYRKRKMAEYHQESKYPPGWDCKYDTNTGKCYYINYLTKAMQLEDPRIRYRQLQNERASNESIPMQPMHGSPYHVYPTNNYPAVQAFQGPSTTSIHNKSSSPLLATKIHQMEMSPVMRHGSITSHTPRMMSQLAKQHIQQQQQETSFITQAETDAAVTKINTMFPTASEPHIRLLLKKYYNREAVVISALQVEKHPVTTPGPFSTPPPPGRHNMTQMGVNSLMSMTPPLGRFDVASRTGSPIPRPSSCASGSYGSPRVGEGIRSSPKPHSSPKMKLRYLKSIFPKAEETLLLDILANADNNVQIASEKLLAMGYEKRDTTAPKLTNRNKEEQVMKDRKIAENTPPPVPKIRTNDEKNKIKMQLQAQYSDVAERIIVMALESVDYSVDRACQILQIVMQDDKSGVKTEKVCVAEEASVDNKSAKHQSRSDIASSSSTSSLKSPSSAQAVKSKIRPDDSVNNIHDATTKTISSSTSPDTTVESLPSDEPATITDMSISKKSKRSRSKARSDHLKSSPDEECDGTPHAKDVISPTAVNRNTEFKSVLDRVRSGGPNTELYRGPNDDILLVDYITWNGPNPDLCAGTRNLAIGSDPSLRTARTVVANGPNHDLYTGSKGLAKGSIYSQINRPMANVKCN